MAAEIRRGVPSHVTGDPAADAIALTRDELRERMSGNLCRGGAYNGIVAAITETFATQGGDHHAMTPFTYTRATDTADALRPGADPLAKHLGGGTILVDLLRETLERPAGRPGGRHRPVERRRGTRRRQPAPRRGGQENRRRGAPGRADALSGALPRHRGGASAQIRNPATVGGNLLQRIRPAAGG